jgi:hypothetical protein
VPEPYTLYAFCVVVVLLPLFAFQHLLRNMNLKRVRYIVKLSPFPMFTFEAEADGKPEELPPGEGDSS